MDSKTAEMMHELDTLRQVIAEECPPRDGTFKKIFICQQLIKRAERVGDKLKSRLNPPQPYVDEEDDDTPRQNMIAAEKWRAMERAKRCTCKY